MGTAIEKKFTPKKWQLKVRRSNAGLGLFALQDIPKGSCIIEYKGRVLSEAEEYTSQSLYLFAVTKKKTIDGRSRENTARYINHSCRPNCEVEIDEDRGRVFVFAKRNIKAGEELAYNYGSSYFNAHIKPKGCTCVKCRPDLHQERHSTKAVKR